MEQINLLIVDDAEIDREILTRLLARGNTYDYIITEVESGEKALEVLREHSFDCVLLDVNLPDYQGVDLLTEVLGLDPYTPVIMLTGAYSYQMDHQAAEHGAYDFLTKGGLGLEQLERSIHFVREKAKTFQMLRHAESKAQEANEIKSRFLAQVSHEIKNPIHQICALTQFIKAEEENPLSEQQKMYVDMIHLASEKMLSLVDNLLELTKFESGSTKHLPHLLSLRDCIHKLSNEHAVIAKMRGLDFELHISEEIPEQLTIDEACLTRIVDNFLSNAIKFTEKGGVSIRVYASEEKDLVIAVKDTGVGIPQSFLEKIFTPYEHLSLSVTQHYGGTGLGMAIANQAAQLMGGEIYVESEENKGSLFSVYIPNVIEKWDK